jgi:hypothetical protein
LRGHRRRRSDQKEIGGGPCGSRGTFALKSRNGWHMEIQIDLMLRESK